MLDGLRIDLRPIKRNPGFAADVMPMLGARAATGRLLVADDFRAGAAPVVVVSHALWQRQFGGDAGVVGRALTIDGQARIVAGVASREFRLLPFFGTEPDLLTVLAAGETANRSKRSVFAIGRLKQGATTERAAAELCGVMRAAGEQDPSARGWAVVVRKARGLDLTGDGAFVVVLAAGVAFVLLIVCANVTNLMLGRASGRTRELSTRLALGAGGARIARQLLTESLALGAGGSAVGLALAYWACRGISLYLSGTNFALLDISLDGRAAIFASGVSAACAVAAGLLPSIRSARLSVVDGLKDGRWSMGRGSPGRLRRARVALEVALALVLLVGSGLVLRGLVNLRQDDPGFVAEGISFAAVALSDDRYGREQPRASYVDEALSRLRQQRVLEAAATSFVPMTGAELPPQPFVLEGRPDSPDSPTAAGLLSVSPTFFRTMRIPVKAGRVFDERDRAGSLPVAIVDERLVEKWASGRSPVGLTVRLGMESRTIVGVVGAVRHFHLNVNPAPAIYVPYAQRPTQGVAFVLRTADSDPAAAVPRCKAAIAGVDSHQAVRGGRVLTDVIAETLGGFNMTSVVVALLAILALGLSAVGIYSVVACSVSRRTREIGIRTALGASPRRLVRDVVAEGVRMSVTGAVPGLLLSVALGRLLSSKLHRVSALDPLVLAGACAVVVGTVLLASYVPARRASTRSRQRGASRHTTSQPETVCSRRQGTAPARACDDGLRACLLATQKHGRLDARGRTTRPPVAAPRPEAGARFPTGRRRVPGAARTRGAARPSARAAGWTRSQRSAREGARPR